MFMKRSGDEWEALQIAEAMESKGATVVAITVSGTATHEGALAPHNRYAVWARIPDVSLCDVIDAAIEEALEK